MCPEYNAGQHFNIRELTTPFKCGKFKIFWNDTNKTKLQELEIKNLLCSGNAGYHSIQNIVSSSLLFKNTTPGIYRRIVLFGALYGCETWSPTLREEHRMELFENGLLRKKCGLKKWK